ncbi:MAG: fluoride efflux transporter FluC [Demequina sp.]
MTLPLFLLAVIACGVGSTLRYAISRLDRRKVFPWTTMAANVTGSAIMGVVAAAVLVGGASLGWLVVVGGGLASGLSTFSTFAVDAVILWREERPRATLAYLGGTLATGLSAAGIGWWCGAALF